MKDVRDGETEKRAGRSPRRSLCRNQDERSYIVFYIKERKLKGGFKYRSKRKKILRNSSGGNKIRAQKRGVHQNWRPRSHSSWEGVKEVARENRKKVIPKKSKSEEKLKRMVLNSRDKPARSHHFSGWESYRGGTEKI